MKKAATLYLSIIILLTCIATADEIFQQLHTTAADAKTMIFQTITTGKLNYPSACTKIITAQRAAVLKAILPVVKEYTTTPDFKTRYTDWYSSTQPIEPLSIAQRKAKRAESNLNIINSATTAEAKEIWAEINRDADASDSLNFEKETAVYKTRYANWLLQKEPDWLLKKYLHQYLDIAATVDFNATTHEDEYGRQVFTNPAYQSQSADWKMIYRAGKESNEYAETFVHQWLSEIK